MPTSFWRPWVLIILLHAGFAKAANPALTLPMAPAPGAPISFEVDGPSTLFTPPVNGRLLIVLGRTQDPPPMERIGTTGLDAEPLIGADLKGFNGSPTLAPPDSAIFPVRAWSEIPDGTYFAQAVLLTNRDVRLPNAPGNFHSDPLKIVVRASAPERHRLKLSHQLPTDSLPPDTEGVRYLKFKSERLSAFHARPMFLRVAVTLPLGWTRESDRRYPVLTEIGGYGTRYFHVGPIESRSPEFRAAWLSTNGPRFILVHLDGAGPWGDPYQVNSDNNGPYGDALVKELLPYIESTYRGQGNAAGRFLTGGSTGGWVSLALQILYPDTFGGCWSGYPDSPDFRSFETINVYGDTNAYVNSFGFERPSKRTRDGEVEFTVRHECQLENVLGDGTSFVSSGGQWGAWNAVYSPRGADGYPVPIWEPVSGTLGSEALRASWERYDLRLILERNWSKLGPQLRGKIHIWVGDADDYFLDGGVRRLEAFLKTAKPPAEARIEFGPGQRHGWEPRSWTQLLDEMQAMADQKNRP